MPAVVVWRGGEKSVIEVAAGELVCDALAKNGVPVARPCGGRGVCGKCEVALAGSFSAPTDAEKRLGKRLACQARILGDARIRIPEAGEMRVETGGRGGLIKLNPMPGRLGAAVDIGTTTLALKLFDLSSGECLATSAGLNPQTSVAADVMGRIGAALSGGLEALQGTIVSAIGSLVSKACAACRRETGEVDAFVAAGNTTMLYLLTGRDPYSLSRAPFKASCLFDETVDVLGAKCYLPPCMNAFVGADITCAALSCGMCETEETSLLCDIGTNGEIALWRGGTLYVTSTAAGPAFEGAGISCGVGSVPGAIDKVGIVNNALYADTIGGKKAVGICGSGLIDAVASLLRLGEIDETGATDNDTLPIKDGVSLLPRDIRAVQLAKAAIAAGIDTVLDYSGVGAGEIKRVYLAGGFGGHINISSAVGIGLIPRELAPLVSAAGNAALAGAGQMLLDKGAIARARDIAKKSRHVELGGNARFNERYMENIMFPIFE